MQLGIMTSANGHPGTRGSNGSSPAVVYIVDDDAAVRAAVGMLVESHGWQARPLASPQEFLLAYDRRRPGCVVLDLRMSVPGITAFELQAIITNLGLPVRVIVVTAGDVDGHPVVERARAGGALGVLAKPFREAELIGCIRSALDSLV
ncbi:MAG: response regulator [Gammaproteobacteria bacterium]|nr:response regulator [Gammaproteobacteria bacterium]